MVQLEQVKSLLEKVGIDIPEKMSLERAIQKLTNHVNKNGLPDEIDDKEEAALIELGLSESEEKDETDEPDDADDPPAKKGKKAEKAVKKVAKKATKPTGDGPKRIGLMPAFRDLWAKKKAIPRAEVISTLVEQFGEGHKGTINNYIHKAMGSDNKIGITLSQSKGKDGKNVLTKTA